jgi:hypothetical protein
MNGEGVMKLQALQVFRLGASGRRRFGSATAGLLAAVDSASRTLNEFMRRSALRAFRLTAVFVAGPLFLVPGLASAYVTLDLIYTPKDTTAYQQQQDDPCILGNSDCQAPADWQFIQTPNGGGSNEKVDLWSFGTDPGNQGTTNTQSFTFTPDKGKYKDQLLGPYYTYDQLLAVNPGGSFFIGIDTQGSSTPQYLQQFDIWECAPRNPDNPVAPSDCSLLARYQDSTTHLPDAGIGGLMDQNVGTGFTNYILKCHDDGSGCANPELTDGKWYAFHAIYWQNGGVDAFFLLDDQSVPCEGSCVSIPAPAPISLLAMGAFAAFGFARRRTAGRARRPW